MVTKQIFPILAIATMGVTFTLTVGCGHKPQAKVEVAVSTPAPPPPPAPPAPPAPPPPPAPPKPRLVAVGKASIVGNRIHIPGELEFDTGKATINHTPAGDEILDTLLKIMQGNSQITKLRIEGHTDNKGTDAANMKLSQARADAVVAWLVSKGIDQGRFDSKGYGSTKPLVPNDTADHRAQNRRTEFHVEELNGAPAPDDTGTTATTAAPAPTK
jgi:OmpA-OmpF porin, OOP family